MPALRPLTAVLAAMAGGEYRLGGVQRMHERPIRDLVDALGGSFTDRLHRCGFRCCCILRQSRSRHRSVFVAMCRSQFLTAMLLALPGSSSGGRIMVEGELISKPYIEVTLAMMARFGVQVSRDGWRSFHVPSARYRSPGEIFVEDSLVSFLFLAAGLISGLHGGPCGGRIRRRQRLGRHAICGNSGENGGRGRCRG